MALAGFLLSHANTDGPKAMEAYLLDWVNLLLRWTHPDLPPLDGPAEAERLRSVRLRKLDVA